MSISRVAVVGAGLLGLATAREVTRRFPGVEVTVFDKAAAIAAHQSGHASGIVDSGLLQAPGSDAATLARRGVQLLVPYMAEQGVPYRECGQLLLAQDTDEAELLEEHFARARDNEVPGVRLLERHELGAVEPAARGVLGLFAPHAAIADFAALAEALASDVRGSGGQVRLHTEVTGFDVMSNEVRLRGRTVPPTESSNSSGGGADPESANTGRRNDTAAEPGGSNDHDDTAHERPRTYRRGEGRDPVVGIGDEMRERFGDQDWFKQADSTLSDWTERLSSSWSGRNSGRPGHPDTVGAVLGRFDTVIVCAGLHADRLAAAAGLETEPRIVPFASDCYRIPTADTEVVRGIIGSVPDPQTPFAETTVVRGLDDGLVLGPNSFVALGRETYDKHGFDLGDIGSTARFKGFWKFAAQTVKTAARDRKPLVSRSAFVDKMRKYVPELDPAAIRQGPRGVRAQAMTDAGELIDDLTMARRGRLTVVKAVPKWGATSALSIGEAIVARAFDGDRRRED